MKDLPTTKPPWIASDFGLRLAILAWFHENPGRDAEACAEDLGLSVSQVADIARDLLENGLLDFAA